MDSSGSVGTCGHLSSMLHLKVSAEGHIQQLEKNMLIGSLADQQCLLAKASAVNCCGRWSLVKLFGIWTSASLVARSWSISMPWWLSTRWEMWNKVYRPLDLGCIFLCSSFVCCLLSCVLSLCLSFLRKRNKAKHSSLHECFVGTKKS